uniref:Uncharacterized protein n=1 Tax=Ananas comosus var. bracteatus TaxID=296719 RepID=A0A6V7PBU5_ANACO|nr:unnamed protein product [Ananas comosus var. bracteatus]
MLAVRSPIESPPRRRRRRRRRRYGSGRWVVVVLGDVVLAAPELLADDAVAHGRRGRGVGRGAAVGGAGLYLIHLLLNCAHEVAAGALERASALLDHVSALAHPSGDPMQRLAASFADALARRALLRSFPGLLRSLSPSAPPPPHRRRRRRRRRPRRRHRPRRSATSSGSAPSSPSPPHSPTTPWPRPWSRSAWSTSSTSAPPPTPPRRRPPPAPGVPARRAPAPPAHRHPPRPRGPRPPRLVPLQGGRAPGRPLPIPPPPLPRPPPPRPGVPQDQIRRGPRRDLDPGPPLPPLLLRVPSSFLYSLQRLRPKVLVLAEQESDHNGPTLVARFVESLNFYAALFDCLESAAPATPPSAPPWSACCWARRSATSSSATAPTARSATRSSTAGPAASTPPASPPSPPPSPPAASSTTSAATAASCATTTPASSSAGRTAPSSPSPPGLAAA